MVPCTVSGQYFLHTANVGLTVEAPTVLYCSTLALALPSDVFLGLRNAEVARYCRYGPTPVIFCRTSCLHMEIRRYRRGPQGHHHTWLKDPPVWEEFVGFNLERLHDITYSNGS